MKLFNFNFIRMLLLEGIQDSLGKFKSQNAKNVELIQSLTPDIEKLLTSGLPETTNSLGWLLNIYKRLFTLAHNPNNSETEQDQHETNLHRFLYEDLEGENGYKQYMKLFDEFKVQYPNKFTELGLNKSIDSYKDRGALGAAVRAIKQSIGVQVGEAPKSKKERSAERKAALSESFEDMLPYVSTSKIDIFKIFGYKAANEAGKNTSWCTASIGQARHYLSMGPLYVFTKANDRENKIAQLHPTSNQYKDTRDEDITQYSNDEIEAFKVLSEKDTDVKLYFILRQVPGITGDAKQLAFSSPACAYQYAINSKDVARLNPEERIQLKTLINSSPHYAAYLYLFVNEHERAWNKKSPIVDLLAAGPGKEGAQKILTSVLATKDPTLVSRLAGAYELDTDEVRKFLEQKNNPTAIVTFVAGAPTAAALLKPIWDTLKADKELFDDAIEMLTSGDESKIRKLIEVLDELAKTEQQTVS